MVARCPSTQTSEASYYVGLSQIRIGELRQAEVSLIVNGLLGWATVDAFRDGNDRAGGFFAVLGVGFYVGNITGSAQSADCYNTYQEERFQARFPE